MITPTLPHDLVETVRCALAEDIGSGDITAQLVAEDKQAQARIISREPAIMCGQAWVNEVFKQIDDSVQITWLVNDGDSVAADQELCRLQGNARSLLTGERSALNFVQTLSATATQAHTYTQCIADTTTRILDTRKTIPCLRTAQKYAVVCGGGKNHRIGLFDAFLIKENHIAAAGSIAAAVNAARQLAPDLPVEVEVENLQEVQQALDAKADILLLDNFSLSLLSEAVALTQKQAKLEASGDITLENVREVALTGVDFISIGAITKHVRAIDLSMRFID